MTRLTITPGPVTDTSCTFVTDAPIHQGAEVRFTAAGEADVTPLAQAILAVPGVDAVVLAEQSFTVEKRPEVGWDRIEGPLQYAVKAVLEGEPGGTPAPGWSGTVGDDALFDLVADLFEREINPSVARHGGKVELIDVQNATVILRMQGGCQGCGMATVTLRQGIEASLRRLVPELRGVEDITDHSAGTNPYFASSQG